ncbi:MAG: hypothetical protein F6K48_03370 [Okeania sp. SIO3H1]|nr:hypothetical protein [Okeania sp. SIO3H1]
MNNFPLKSRYKTALTAWAEHHNFTKLGAFYRSQFHNTCPPFPIVVEHAIRCGVAIPDLLFTLGWLTTQAPENLGAAVLANYARVAFFEEYEDHLQENLNVPLKGYPPRTSGAVRESLDKMKQGTYIPDTKSDEEIQLESQIYEATKQLTALESVFGSHGPAYIGAQQQLHDLQQRLRQLQGAI